TRTPCHRGPFEVWQTQGVLEQPWDVAIVRKGGEAVDVVDYEARILGGVHYRLACQTPLAPITHLSPFCIPSLSETDDTRALCCSDHKLPVPLGYTRSYQHDQCHLAL